jgi:hypothetical protein
MVVGDRFDSIGVGSFKKSPVSKERYPSKNRYPSTPSASAVATTIKTRERVIAVCCLVSGDGAISRMADVSDRRGVFDDDSLIRTRLASQKEQATCFQLIEEG